VSDSVSLECVCYTVNRVFRSIDVKDGKVKQIRDNVDGVAE